MLIPLLCLLSFYSCSLNEFFLGTPESERKGIPVLG